MMNKKLLTLCMVLMTLGATGAINAENEKPFVIPELRNWQGGEGSLTIDADTRVLYTDATLAVAAEELA